MGEDREVTNSGPARDTGGPSSIVPQATEAADKLRSVIDQASQTMHELTQASERWAQVAQERGREIATQLRGQGERAVGEVSRQVEHNPLASLAIAFAVGWFFATLTRRR